MFIENKEYEPFALEFKNILVNSWWLKVVQYLC